MAKVDISGKHPDTNAAYLSHSCNELERFHDRLSAPLKKGCVRRCLVLGCQLPDSFFDFWQLGPELKGLEAARNHKLANGLIRN